ncbi:MAG TPA: ABC transporter ATP-binding protein [Gemmatimonadales bacterium]|nr:ABC transporter ATP-binding protein [Gemmatimonadales bacterium]
MLDLLVGSRRGEFELELALQARGGSTTVIVGESGAGKTSVLRLAAGLDRPVTGRIVLDGEVYTDTAADIHVPPWRRSVGYVSQDYALFPHLSVAENVAFGLRAAGVRSGEIRARVARVLERTGIAELARRKPSTLSGGQQQRAALARALVLDPRLLLLDEPLAALDLQTRRKVRGELRRLLRELETTTLYVTHSPIEALLFGDHIVVLEGGRISQVGDRDELLRHPRSRYVAELVGTNFFAGRATATGVAATVRTADGDLAISRAEDPADLFVTVNPRDITLHTQRPEGSAQNVFAGPILELAPEPPGGERVRVVLGTRPPLVAEVTREAVASLGLAEGITVHASFKATGIRAYR